jgi:hypothetical protein
MTWLRHVVLHHSRLLASCLLVLAVLHAEHLAGMMALKPKQATRATFAAVQDMFNTAGGGSGQ